MPVSPSFRTFVLDQLGRAAPGIRARSMFGGVGIYSGDLFFAVIDEDTVYFKVDDTNRPDFEARGMAQLSVDGIEPADGRLVRSADIRYKGQINENVFNFDLTTEPSQAPTALDDPKVK